MTPLYRGVKCRKQRLNPSQCSRVSERDEKSMGQTNLPEVCSESYMFCPGASLSLSNHCKWPWHTLTLGWTSSHIHWLWCCSWEFNLSPGGVDVVGWVSFWLLVLTSQAAHSDGRSDRRTERAGDGRSACPWAGPPLSIDLWGSASLLPLIVCDSRHLHMPCPHLILIRTLGLSFRSQPFTFKECGMGGWVTSLQPASS